MLQLNFEEFATRPGDISINDIVVPAKDLSLYDIFNGYKCLKQRCIPQRKSLQVIKTFGQG